MLGYRQQLNISVEKGNTVHKLDNQKLIIQENIFLRTAIGWTYFVLC